MKMLYLAFLLSLAAAACGPTKQAEQSLKIVDSEQGESRAHLFRVRFSKFADFIQLDSGVGLNENGQSCRFLKPLVKDESTRWPPMQSYWVVRDDVEDVHVGNEISGTFFQSDALTTSEIKAVDDKPVLGFSYLTDTHAQRMPLKGISIAPTGDRVEAELGDPMNVRIRGLAVVDGTKCAIKALYCESNLDCTQEAHFKSFNAISIKQNFLGVPKQITFEHIAD